MAAAAVAAIVVVGESFSFFPPFDTRERDGKWSFGVDDRQFRIKSSVHKVKRLKAYLPMRIGIQRPLANAHINRSTRKKISQFYVQRVVKRGKKI